MEDTLSNLVTYGYIGLFIYSLGGGFVGVVAASVLSFMGKMDLTLSITIAFLGNAIGDVLLFWMARNQKAMMQESLRKHRRKVALAHILMKKHGDWVVFIQKFIYGLKTVVPIAMALTKYDFKKFTLLNIFAAALWALAFGLSSYYFGAVLSKFAVFISANKWLVPVILLGIGGVVWIYLERVTKKK